MKDFFGRPWGWVAAAPALCAVHCAATPLLLLAVPTLALWRGVELTLLAVTMALAVAALTVGYRRHRRIPPIVAAGAGLAIWGASAGHLIHRAPEEVTTMAGALLVAGALLRNSQLLCRSREPACGCVACEDTAAADAPLSATDPAGRLPGSPKRDRVTSYTGERTRPWSGIPDSGAPSVAPSSTPDTL